MCLCVSESWFCTVDKWLFKCTGSHFVWVTGALLAAYVILSVYQRDSTTPPKVPSCHGDVKASVSICELIGGEEMVAYLTLSV